ncbi:MAG: formate dehydrogenase subunit delta [Proteobacteria bacterium]|nr:formate dehydrogenase subunit delta [Pseudomonadota bacterium]
MNHDPHARLVQMANQIAQFFEAQPVHAEAVNGVADHIRRFWEPRMRHAIYAYVDGGGTELRPLAREAVAKLAAASKTSST